MIRSRSTAVCAMGFVVGVFASLLPPTPAIAGTAARVQAAPTPRFEAAMSNDGAGHVILFSGLRLGRSSGDTWIWDGSSWTRHNGPPPTRRFGMGMAYDAADGQVVMFGGSSTTRVPKDLTWTWDGSSWTQRNPVHEPPWRRQMGMAYDPATKRVLMFGGQGQTEYGDTWAWDGTDWTQLHPTHSPSPRDGMGMVYDPAEGRIVLFGGSGPHDDTWTWDGTDWTQVSTPRAPSPRSDFGMAYSSATGQIVLFGGYDMFGETWTWNGSGWKLHHTAHAPTTRGFDAMASDPTDGNVLLNGGQAGDSALGDTWTWNGTDWTVRVAGSMRVSGKTGRGFVVVWLWGFEPGERVRITFVDSVQGNTLMAKVKTDKTGGFMTDPLLIPEGSTPGKQAITAKGARSGQVARVGHTIP